jgi:hypothetical protein
MEGIDVKLLSGLKSLNVLRPDIPFIEGISLSSDVTTTIKSNQFQASLK